MKRKIRAFLMPDPNFWWTAGGAVPILWNATHWRKGPHISGLARKHPVATGVLLIAYGYHFGLHEALKRERHLLEEVALAAADGAASTSGDAG